MRRRRIAVLAGAAVCAAVAVFLALLARDVGRVQAALRTGDVQAADTRRAAPPSWSAHELIPFGLAASALAVDDDIAFRKAVALFKRAHTQIPSFDQGLEGTSLRVQAEAALAREIRIDGDRRRAATAANLLGVLALADATSTDQSSTPIERSIFEFQAAIRLDPDNEAAKANLELAYQLTAPPTSEKGTDRRRGRTRSGASASSPGHGY